MKKTVLSIAIIAVVALVVVFQMQPVRADAAVSPGKPSNVSVELQGERTLYVSWDASPRERAGILYEIFYRRSGAATWTPVAVGYEGTPGVSYSTRDPIVVPTLGKYQVRVKACNYYTSTTVRCNDSAAATVQVGAAPAKPTGLKLTQIPPNHDINVAWDAVEDADKYKIRWRAKDASLGDPIFSTTTQTTVPLDEYDDWVVRVEACNDAGCGKPASETITTTARPPRPTGIVVEQKTDYSRAVFRIQWDPAPGATTYNMWASNSSGVRVSNLLVVARGYTSFSYSEMAWWWRWGYGKWTLTLNACNSAGCTSVVVPVNLVKPPLPAKPTGLEVSQASADSLKADVEFDSVEFAAEYKIRWRKAGPGNDLNEGITRSANAGSETVNAQITVDEYDSWIVSVEACNASGCADASSKVSVEGTTPAGMSNFEVEDVPSSQSSGVAASWDEIPHATHYEVKWIKWGEEFKPEHAANVPAGKNSFKTALPSGQAWIVRARACNVNLCGPAVSEALSVTIVIQVPQFEEIQGLRVNAKRASWNGFLEWNIVERATYYEVWYVDRDNPTAGMVPHRRNQPKLAHYKSSYILHEFWVPPAARWDFLVKACDDDGCFAAAHTQAFFDEPEEE